MESSKAKKAQDEISINLFFIFLASIIILFCNMLALIGETSPYYFFIMICIYLCFCFIVSSALKGGDKVEEKNIQKTI